MDFVSEQRRATDFVETVGRAGGKQQPTRCSRKIQDKFAISFMSKKLLYRCIGAHALVHVHLLQRVCMHFTRCCEHHACAGVYVRCVRETGVVNISEHICVHARYRMCIFAHVCAVCSFIVGEQGWGGRGGLFLAEGEIGQVQARGRDETPGGPEESRRTKSRHMCIRICVQSLYMFVYAKRRDEILD